jgi:importin subunit beta-1
VAALAYVQLPLNEWPDLLPFLHQSIVQKQPSRRAALEALGFICEEVPSACLEGASGEILSAVVQGLGAAEESLPVRLAASASLLNALSFLKPRLEAREEERNAVLRAVFEAVSAYTVSTPSALSLAVSALECLVGLGEALYAHLRPYMHQGLAELTVNAMSSPEPQISLQGIEFWCTICEVEIEVS